MNEDLGGAMTSEQLERVRDELEIIINTAEYGMECVSDKDELKEIMADIKRSYGIIIHIANEK